MIEIHDTRVTRQPNDDTEPISIVYVQDNSRYVLLGTGADVESAKEVAIHKLLLLVQEIINE